MLTQTQIDAGNTRNLLGKLKDTDVTKMISVFRMFLGDLEEKYSYDFDTKLRALDDTIAVGQKAAQVAACIIEMESLGFGVAELSGGLNYKEKSDYFQYVVIALSQIYNIPYEVSGWDIRRKTTNAKSSVAFSHRMECPR